MDFTAPVERVNMDGVEGSSMPGGLYAARYGGGDSYLSWEPILSLYSTVSATRIRCWSAVASALSNTTGEQLQRPHGYAESALLPNSKAPEPDAISWSLHLLVTKIDSPWVNLYLHGWLFDEFVTSGRKAHQKFPLLAVFDAINVAPPPSSADGMAAPEWLPLGSAFGWADQHVHKDEPIDLGDGFMFSEVFFGSDMARVAIADCASPAAFWLAAVDSETAKGVLTLCVLLPPSFPSAVEARLRQEDSLEGIAAALLAGLPDSAASREFVEGVLVRGQVGEAE